MAIPARQIGWSTQSNLLWSISKELERLLCSCKTCPTTTTTTTLLSTNYNVIPCLNIENPGVITYVGNDTLPAGTVVIGTELECYTIVDVTTDPENYKFVIEIFPTLNDCEGCVISLTTTTTTTL